MAMSGAVAMLLANDNTSEVAEGLGFIKGAPCTIADIRPVLDDEGNLMGNDIIFEWTGQNGTVRTQTLRVLNGKDGKDGTGTGDDPSITEAQINDICRV